MKLTHLWLLLAFGAALHAAAPASLDGYIFRASILVVRSSNMTTVALSSHGSYETLLLQSYLGLPGRLSDYGKPEAGSFTYERIDDQNAQLHLTDETSGNRTDFALYFTSELAGTIVRASGNGYFSLQPPAGSGARSLVNISTRVVARAGSPAIVGFVVTGDQPREFLIRAVGPGLAALGVTDAWQTPRFHFPRIYLFPDDLPSLFRGTWSGTPENRATLERAAARVGAFPLTADSHDLADVVRLNPGVYTIVVDPDSPTDGGTVLIEVYEL